MLLLKKKKKKLCKRIGTQRVTLGIGDMKSSKQAQDFVFGKGGLSLQKRQEKS